MVGLRGGVHHRCAAEAGFVGEQTARDAVAQRHHHRRAGESAGGRGAGERALEDEPERSRDLSGVAHEDDQAAAR